MDSSDYKIFGILSAPDPEDPKYTRRGRRDAARFSRDLQRWGRLAQWVGRSGAAVVATVLLGAFAAAVGVLAAVVLAFTDLSTPLAVAGAVLAVGAAVALEAR